ncbi:platelet-activating factor receptor-like [Engraulis encrasicolus]|uniref:platelet-activating factor receptor-like n=1 Tax=Engraulis encrasicolus TaxID=184585 RepID=UPI002FD42E5B
MTMNPLFSLVNESINHTSEHFDPYCLDFPIGPIIWAILSSPCALVGVPASVWLLWVLVQRQRSGTGSSNDIYMLNLTVMDVLATIQVLPYQLNFFLLKYNLLRNSLDFVYAINMMGRPLLMACICWDCCMAVCYPIFYMRMTRTHYRLITSAVSWAVAIAWASPVFILQNFPDILLSIPYFLTLPVIVGCDVAILRALKKPDPSGKTDVHPQKQRALLAITQSLVLTVLVFLPPMVIFVVTPHLSLTPQEIYCCVSIPAVVPPSLASMLMPLMYLHSLGSFRDLRRCGHEAGLD